VPLRRIGLDPKARESLEKLGCRTVGELVRLPAESVLLRFGTAVHRLHRLASGALRVQLAPVFEIERPRAHVDLDFPVASSETLSAWIEELARPLLARLAVLDQAAAELTLELVLEDRSTRCERIAPAEPTLDLAQLLRLLRLRFEQVRLACGAERITVELVGAPASHEQLRLFALQPGRDPEAAAQAFAALRAAFGDDVVVRAKLRATPLPEGSVAWGRVGRHHPPRVREVTFPPLIRRVFTKAVPLPPRPRRAEDGWMLCGLTHGPVAQLHGPHLVSGGWWRSEVERDYYFAEMQSGRVFWIYYDRPRRRWFLQGSVS
jgi:protein ImuB